MIIIISNLCTRSHVQTCNTKADKNAADGIRLSSSKWLREIKREDRRCELQFSPILNIILIAPLPFPVDILLGFLCPPDQFFSNISRNTHVGQKNFKKQLCVVRIVEELSSQFLALDHNQLKMRRLYAKFT